MIKDEVGVICCGFFEVISNKYFSVSTKRVRPDGVILLRHKASNDNESTSSTLCRSE
jgi:hypothetical protein